MNLISKIYLNNLFNEKMKFILLILTFFTTVKITAQITIAEKTNILLIAGTVNPRLAEFLINPKNNSSFVLTTNGYDFKFGEYIESKNQEKYTLNYNDFGFLKFDYFLTDKRYNSDRDFTFNDYPIKIGAKGEFLHKENYKYKYDKQGLITDILQYDKEGSYLEKHCGFKYNQKNQIIDILYYNGDGVYVNDISSYTYDNYGNIILTKNYSKTTNKNFPICENFKLIYKYNSYNQLISYHSFKNNYGYHWFIGGDMYKYVKGKKIPKTLAENHKEMKENYLAQQNYEYTYNDTKDKIWASRTEYSINNYGNIPKTYTRKDRLKEIE